MGPDPFIPLAEQTGLIRPLTRLILRQAMHQTRVWRDSGFDMTVAVNLTMADIADSGFPEELAALLDSMGLPPAAIEIEITESMIMDDPLSVKRTLNALSDLGVGLAIDDFGTGHSSLAHLKVLPADTLKVDKSFVLNMAEEESDAAIVRSTIELARTLGLKVVAESVESAEVWQMLASYGCDYGQGYVIARPMSAQAINQLLAGYRERGVAEQASPEALSA
jgi:EAL domain-containing protein (putative c-di-GMP-specific phosphodiesterase class I)